MRQTRQIGARKAATAARRSSPPSANNSSRSSRRDPRHYAARADLRRITFLPRLTIASPDHEPIYFRSPRDEDSPPSSSAARFEPLGAIWVDFGTIIGGSALADAPQSTVFDAVPLHRLTASPGGLDVSDVVLDDAVQMRPRSTGGELLVASTCRKMGPERRRF